jgi:CubicO group peptidase (beta-lactamase class C family)
MKKLILKLAIANILFLSGCDSQVNLNYKPENGRDTEWINYSLEDFKKNEKIKGLAFAIFDSAQIIEEFCLGKSTYNFPIDRQTLFSIQSISKNMTALAVMFAIQDSLLTLDKPISEYLPNFKIQSCFESNPVQSITLEMLLSHTAGFTHEAPIGNNFNFDHCSFSEHLNSISETWLKFHAGSNYAYSNLGFDIAAYIVEQTSGLDFNEYLSKKIFAPLGMETTSINDRDFIESTNKTEGIMPFTKNNHLNIPLLGSGAIYTNLNDFIKYVQFFMSNGYADENLIDDNYLLNMYKIRKKNYGLGTFIGKNNGNYFINHNGGGYGYSASFIWFTEFNLGGVLLCNKSGNTFNTTKNILNEFISRTNRKKEPSLSKRFQEINLNLMTSGKNI